MKKRLKLEDLLVKSFVTALNEQHQLTLKGEGIETRIACTALCSTHQSVCNATRNACEF